MNALKIGEGAVQLHEGLSKLLAAKIETREAAAGSFKGLQLNIQRQAQDLETVERRTLETMDAEIAQLRDLIGEDETVAKAA